ncbi:hypothetical protein TMatcc_005504 [Talaromyces marneffei ATCC 18224]|uniref:DUF1308 domain-containing protein n=3 Tax=Talaromyces marneffei TaxID=37727 RepID=B6QA74_TALMQ|nr:uncharacterized protein EYB26_005956 [Talaromyces marneffei]EEA26238.1 conserved hypothetical protein [Talaromyces marneffei ATCC 18224]KAE8554934.1 hypothetical protein EYB25_003481 [Talaromyces marneffei]QGA18272.1 hypothetical protein EYB26_005956 [Talaromyces marneffei]
MEKDSDEEAKASTTLTTISATILCTRLIHHCRLLLAELDIFQKAIASRFRRHQQQQHLVEMRLLRSNVTSELKTLERLASDTRALVAERAEKEKLRDGRQQQNGYDDDDTELEMREGRIIHTLRSSNLSFLTAVWTIAKERCPGVISFSKRFYWDKDANKPVEGKEDKQAKPPNKDKKKSAFVDIVYGNGEDWMKVSSVNESRLLFEMAEKGWELDSDEEGESSSLQNAQFDPAGPRREIPIDHGEGEEDGDQLELITMAFDMIKASRATRVRYKNPRVHIIAPKLEEGKVPEIDKVLNIIRSYGVTIECGMQIRDIFADDEAYDKRDPNSITADDLPLSFMLPNPFEKFTDVINVDCTLLLALASDLSHTQNITPSPSFHRAIIRQIEVEDELPLLTTELWPAMVGRQLVCTQEAIKRMKEIVSTIGTETERKRAAILLGEGEMEGLDKDTLLRELQAISDHSIPDRLNLPISVVDAHAEINAALQQKKFPPVIDKITEILTDINHSVFLYGWARDIFTVSSNKTVVKQIESTIEDNRGDDDTLEGPKIWICDTARSLIGKEKNRKP